MPERTPNKKFSSS